MMRETDKVLDIVLWMVALLLLSSFLSGVSEETSGG